MLTALPFSNGPGPFRWLPRPWRDMPWTLQILMLVSLGELGSIAVVIVSWSGFAPWWWGYVFNVAAFFAQDIAPAFCAIVFLDALVRQIDRKGTFLRALKAMFWPSLPKPLHEHEDDRETP